MGFQLVNEKDLDKLGNFEGRFRESRLLHRWRNLCYVFAFVQFAECGAAMLLFRTRPSVFVILLNPIFMGGSVIAAYGAWSYYWSLIISHAVMVGILSFVTVVWATVESLTNEDWLFIGIQAPIVIDLLLMAGFIRAYYVFKNVFKEVHHDWQVHTGAIPAEGGGMTSVKVKRRKPNHPPATTSAAAAAPTSSSAGSTSSSDSTSAGDDELCIICVEREKNCTYTCGHMATCVTCSKVLKKTGQPCPICRRPITEIIRLFK